LPLLAPTPRAWLARQAYALLLMLGTPAYLWRVWSRGREEPAYRFDWPARLGWYGAVARTAWAGQSKGAGEVSARARAPVIWLHAVSLGEARAAAPLIQALRQQCPGMRLLLTHTTATGRDAGKALLRAESGDVQTWLPYDTPGAVRRFLRQYQPQVGVLMETEVWPVLQHEASRARVPMVLANARLSDKSLRQGLRFKALLQPAARALSAVLAQTQGDARRVLALIEPDAMSRGRAPQVQVMGNVKFDMRPDPALLALGQRWRAASQDGEQRGTEARPMVLAASTREGEEPGLLHAWSEALADQSWHGSPKPRLFIVPRHPQRFDEVAELVRAQGLSLSRRSAWPGARPDAAALSADVWLGDSMGEMPAYFASAQVALLGGSFAPLGGQNLIEAAACACPIVMGPSTFNFAEAAQLSEAAGAARRVADVAAGVHAALAWIGDGQGSHRSEVCLAFARAHQGAASRMAAVILGLCKP
jgi:3-deoxy-D-manno-octulosonic-acid transferase